MKWKSDKKETKNWVKCKCNYCDRVFYTMPCYKQRIMYCSKKHQSLDPYKRKKSSKALKGKTYEEIHGTKAEEEKKKRGLGNRGKKRTKKWLKNLSKAHKGNNWEKIYGKKKADKLKEERSKKLMGHSPWGLRTRPKLKGKTWEELYGKEKAEKIKDKIRKKRVKQIIPKKRTSIEVLIEKELIKRNVKFKDQKSLEKITIADFFIEPNIVIYCDGDYWHNLPSYKKRDKRINKALLEKGYKVYRFWGHEIKESPEKCLDKIEELKICV